MPQEMCVRGLGMLLMVMAQSPHIELLNDWFVSARVSVVRRCPLRRRRSFTCVSFSARCERTSLLDSCAAENLPRRIPGPESVSLTEIGRLPDTPVRADAVMKSCHVAHLLSENGSREVDACVLKDGTAEGSAVSGILHRCQGQEEWAGLLRCGFSMCLQRCTALTDGGSVPSHPGVNGEEDQCHGIDNDHGHQHSLFQGEMTGFR